MTKYSGKKIIKNNSTWRIHVTFTAISLLELKKYDDQSNEMIHVLVVKARCHLSTEKIGL